MASILDDLRMKIASGISESDAIAEMRRADLPILEAIKAVRELFQVSLGAAKQLVGNHPAYSQIAKASDTLHEQFMNVIQKEDSVQKP
jgi:ribosomal protein L7/L12